MKKRSHKNTPRLTARERSEAYLDRFPFNAKADIAALAHAFSAHGRDTLAREKRRRVARLSKRTRDAIANARTKVGVARDYLDDAIVELAKGLPL